jgi:H+/gluconate symporter-like permease
MMLAMTMFLSVSVVTMTPRVLTLENTVNISMHVSRSSMCGRGVLTNNLLAPSSLEGGRERDVR